jgi:SAM-dependent methyltransferase
MACFWAVCHKPGVNQDDNGFDAVPGTTRREQLPARGAAASAFAGVSGTGPLHGRQPQWSGPQSRGRAEEFAASRSPGVCRGRVRMSTAALGEAAVALRETPDVASSTDDYANRFAGSAGAYLLAVQNREVLRLAEPWRGGTVLDVGGGHAQLAGPFIDGGCPVTVLGSDQSCFVRPRRIFGDRVSCVEGDLLDPPFPDRSFDVVVAIRMLAHIQDTARFVAGLTRVARHAVIVDYPNVYSLNAITPLLFDLKLWLEGSTRPYRLHRRGDLLRRFGAHGFGKPEETGQFFWPMVLHRALGGPRLSQAVEAATLGLRRRFGSPNVLRVERT